MKNNIHPPLMGDRIFTDSKVPAVTTMAFYLLCMCLFFNYVRPQEFLSFLKPLRISGILSYCISLWLLTHFSKSLFSDKLVRLLWLLSFLFLVSGIYASNTIAYKIGISWVTLLVPFTCALCLLVNTEEKYKKFVRWWVFIHFLVILITFKNGGRGPGDFLNDENDCALALAIALPFAYYMIGLQENSKKTKYFYIACTLLCLAGVVASSSRGGFLGALAAIMVIWWHTRNRAKLMSYALVFALISSTAILSFLPEGYVDDMASISDTKDNTRIERFRSWALAIEMLKGNPLLGVGAGNFKTEGRNYQDLTDWWQPGMKSLHGRATHSMYFELLAEMGLVGTGVYFAISYICIRRMKRIIAFVDRTDTGDAYDFLSRMSKAIVAAWASYAVSGAFISVAYYPHFSILIGFTVITWSLYQLKIGIKLR